MKFGKLLFQSKQYLISPGRTKKIFQRICFVNDQVNFNKNVSGISIFPSLTVLGYLMVYLVLKLLKGAQNVLGTLGNHEKRVCNLTNSIPIFCGIYRTCQLCPFMFVVFQPRHPFFSLSKTALAITTIT